MVGNYDPNFHPGLIPNVRSPRTHSSASRPTTRMFGPSDQFNFTTKYGLTYKVASGRSIRSTFATWIDKNDPSGANMSFGTERSVTAAFLIEK